MPRRLGYEIVIALVTALLLFYTFIQHRDATPSVERPLAPYQAPDFTRGTAKPPQATYTRTLVMGRLKENDMTWLEHLPSDINTTIYVVDDPIASPRVPKNKGREAMVYLTYVIDHYDTLPDTVLFFHPDEIAWHNNILLDLNTANTISRLSDPHVARAGYFNSRCHHDPGCPDWLHIDRPEEEWDFVRKEEERYFTSKLWRELHPSAPLPSSISQPCCAQFAVSAERIRVHPRSEYRRYRDWLLKTELDDQISGRVMEYTWQYLFTGEAEHCPSMHACYCDGYGICFDGAERLQNWLDLLKEREQLDSDADDFVRMEKAGVEESFRLRQQSHEIDQQLSSMKDEALRRGSDPRNRAAAAGRSWREGDGF